MVYSEIYVKNMKRKKIQKIIWIIISLIVMSSMIFLSLAFAFI